MTVGQQFEQKWQENSGKIIRIRQIAELPGFLEGIVRSYGHHGNMPIVMAGLPKTWSDAISQGSAQAAYLWAEGGDKERFRQYCEGSTLGVTGCAWASADAGSVSLYSDSEQSLLPSLLPPIHAVILKESQIAETFQSGLQAMYQHAKETHFWPSLIKVIAGPSMTADIEGQLILGVHGPQDVYAVIVED